MTDRDKTLEEIGKCPLCDRQCDKMERERDISPPRHDVIGGERVFIPPLPGPWRERVHCPNCGWVSK